jgi:acyl carrier protein
MSGVPGGTGEPDALLSVVLDSIREKLPDPSVVFTPADADVKLVDLGFDSLRSVALLVHLEAALGFEFPPDLITDETFRSARTISDAARAVHDPHA